MRNDSDEQFCAVSSEVLPAGLGEVWVYDHLRRRFRSVPESLAQLLPVLSGFRTLHEHRRTAMQAGWQDDGSGYLDTVLSEMIQNGLMRGKREFLQNMRAQAGRGEAPPPIATLGWVTCDRRATLRESVQSFVSAIMKAGRAPALKVFDDSGQAAEREATRALLLELGRQTGLPIRYAGAEEKRAFADELIRRLAPDSIPKEPIEFALFDPFELGHSYGANINAFLLATLGELSLKLDDDTFCRFASLAEPRAGLALSSQTDVTSLFLFPHRSSLEKAFPLREGDPLRAHEALLGRSVAGCLPAQDARSVHCEDASPELLQLLESHPARVAATMAGIHGEAGMGSSRYFLSLTGAGREALIVTEDNYRASLRSRQLLRVVGSPTISQGELFMSMSCGFDNRGLLPPFFPVLRNSDGLFANILRRCMPEGLIGHLPLAGEHRPPEARRFDADEPRSVTIRLMDLLIPLVRNFQPGPSVGESAKRLCSLGNHLLEVSSLEPRAFEEHLRRLWVLEMARDIDHLERLLKIFNGEPDYWAEDVEAYLEAVRQRVDAGPDISPEDIAIRKGADGSLALVQELVRRYGELLTSWPVIVAGARRLKEAGVVL